MVAMTDPDTAQASVLIAALEDQLGEMVPKLTRATHEATLASVERARALRHDVAELSRDVNHAQFLISQLHRRFPAVEMNAPMPVADVV